jgi:hypothetical protein
MSDFAGRWTAGRVADTRLDNVVLDVSGIAADLRATLDLVDRERGLATSEGTGCAENGVLSLDFPGNPAEEPPGGAKLSAMLQGDGQLACLWMTSSEAIPFTLVRAYGSMPSSLATDASAIVASGSAPIASPLPAGGATPSNVPRLCFRFTCAIACGFGSCLLGSLQSNRLLARASDEGPSALGMSLALFGPPLVGGLVAALVLVAGWPAPVTGAPSGPGGAARRSSTIMLVAVTVATAIAFWLVARWFFARGWQS